jgi:ABC-type dipeptide/oligopeptide/nickel transport system permease component
MTRYLITRALPVLPTLLVASMLTFFLMRVIPGDPVDRLAAEGGISPEQAALIRRELGLDLPLWQQYLHWLGGALQGDFGVSLRTQHSVSFLIENAFPRTAELALGAFALAVLIAVPLGIVAAAWRGSLLDHLATLLALVTVSVPTFAIGIVLLLLFAVRLDWLPATGSVVLPIVVLGLDIAGLLVRTLRSDIREELAADYVRTARAKGLGRSLVLRRHVLRNALTTTVTIAGLAFGNILGGTTIVETVFNWPGLGELTIDAIKGRDYPVVQATVLLAATCFIFANLAVDLLYGLIDPRIRTGG